MSPTLVIDVGERLAALDAGASGQLSALVVSRGQPLAMASFPSPGATWTPALLDAVVVRQGDLLLARTALEADLRRRLGAPERPAPSLPPCSVAVCTHRRRADLRRLLADLRRLDPAPLEVVVVDNAPDDDPCRADVEEAGFVYLREDRKGLDNARNAALRRVRGELVAFTDDDCSVPPGWLGSLCAPFAHPAVAAVTGPGFPLALDTPSERRMEAHARLWRGLVPRSFDWQTVAPAEAGVIGVGANMAYRVEHLLALGAEPFPPELDAGTPTESGGDTYVLAQLLAGGHRLAYEPRAFVFHSHRAGGRALHRAIAGYGIGLSAALAKLLVEGREPGAPRAWWWLVRQYGQVQRRRLAGRADSTDTRLAWDYVRGGLTGPGRWWSTRPPRGPVPRPPAREAARPARPGDRGPPVISVVVPTRGRPDALARCLAALASQDVEEPFEVIVADDGVDEPASDLTVDGLRARVVRSGGGGPAVARNTGAAAAAAELLVFVDDDVVAEPGLLAAHLRRHREHPGDVAVVGRYAPRPLSRNLISSSAALWWEDYFARLGESLAPTLTGYLTGNFSLQRATWEGIGPFADQVPRREDWEWGLRAIAAGTKLVFAPEALAWHEFTLDSRRRLRAAEQEGFGDAHLLRLWPDAAAALPAGDPLDGSRGRAGARRLLEVAWRSDPGRAALEAALDVMERARLRRHWSRFFNRVQGAAYRSGLERAGAAPRFDAPLVDVDVAGDEALRPPAAVTPHMRVLDGDRQLATVVPSHGTWDGRLAEQLAGVVPDEVALSVAASRGWIPAVAPERPLAGKVDLIVAGGDHERIASARRLEAETGVRVLVTGGASPWDARVPGDSGIVAVALAAGGFDRRWLDEALVAFEGERVALVLGGGLPEGSGLAPLNLHEPHPGRVALEPLGPPPRYVCFRPETLPAAADLAAAARHGDFGPVLLLVEHALASGRLVARRDVHGFAGPATPREEQTRARLAMLAERALRRPETRAEVARAVARAALELGWDTAKRPRAGLRRVARVVSSGPPASAGPGGGTRRGRGGRPG